jgi:hypothetical protein
MRILQTSLWWWFQGSLAASVLIHRMNANQESLAGEVRLDDDDPDMVKGMLFYLYTFKYPDSINGPATRLQQGEIREDELYHCDTLEGKVFGTKKWWLRHVLMYKIADKYVLPQLKAGARNEIFMQLDPREYGRMASPP